MLINRAKAKVCVDESVLRSSHQSLAATVVTAQTTSLNYRGRAPSTFVHIINFLHSPKLTITTLIYIFNQQPTIHSELYYFIQMVITTRQTNLLKQFIPRNSYNLNSLFMNVYVTYIRNSWL